MTKTSKNVLLRIAAALVVLVLLSMCFISGTFAKYTTSDETADTARVAKWGVVASISNDSMFATEYAKVSTESYTGDKTVISSNTEQKLVAPGTANDTGITLTISGTPEVAVRVTTELKVNSDVVLKKGTYADNPTTGDPVADPYTLDADYTPVVFTLTKDGDSVATGTLAQISAEIEKLEGDYAPNTGLAAINGVYKLTWAWAFTGNDVADTLLANGATDVTGTSTTIDFELSITIEQID